MWQCVVEDNAKQTKKQMVIGTRVLYLFVIWPLDPIGLRKWRTFVWNSCLLSSFCFHKEVDASDCLKFDILRWVNNLLVQKPWLRGSVQNLYVLCHWCTDAVFYEGHDFTNSTENIRSYPYR